MDMAFLILLSLSPGGVAQDAYVVPRVVPIDFCRTVQRDKRQQRDFLEELKQVFPKVQRVEVKCQALTMEQIDRLGTSIAGATK